MTHDERYLTVKQAASRLQCHPETVKRMLRDGELTGSQPLGRRGGWRVAESQILGLLKRPVGHPTAARAKRSGAGAERARALAERREDTRRALERGDLVAAARYEAALAAYGESPLR